jgi:hypothetical protein
MSLSARIRCTTHTDRNFLSHARKMPKRDSHVDGNVYAGHLPLSSTSVITSHGPSAGHYAIELYTCVLCFHARRHHAPRLDASRRTPGAIHLEPQFSALGKFADERLL